eukprot:TRINITY_DN191939_c0_g1_i1.p1 TRINITY_DN191939_c0_g1~~TRINITY_DN191939_c0_g1_i1.p1  ORF type:complete len:132 (-),score=20.00 TRINITY_DN191939_c0_g1_i1:111-506(-)
MCIRDRYITKTTTTKTRQQHKYKDNNKQTNRSPTHQSKSLFVSTIVSHHHATFFHTHTLLNYFKINPCRMTKLLNICDASHTFVLFMDQAKNVLENKYQRHNENNWDNSKHCAASASIYHPVICEQKEERN